MKYQLWKVEGYYALSNGDGWLWFRSNTGWFQSWLPLHVYNKHATLIGNNYKEPKKKRKCCYESV